MGYNTTVLVLNDALGDIENDPEFGRKLAAGIRARLVTGKPVDVSAGRHSNGVRVIETHHSSETAIVAIGGNFGTCLHTMLGSSHHKQEVQWQMIEDTLDHLTNRQDVG